MRRRASWLFEAELKGGHVHVTVRVGPKDEARARAGTFVVDEWQWPVLLELLRAAGDAVGDLIVESEVDVALEVRQWPGAKHLLVDQWASP